MLFNRRQIEGWQRTNYAVAQRVYETEYTEDTMVSRLADLVKVGFNVLEF